MTQEEINNWRKNPTTKAFFKFLEDFKKKISDSVSEDIVSGNPPPQEYIIAAATRCEIYMDIININAEDFTNFYGEEDGEDNQ